MGENSKITWCDHTFSPWIGCAQVSPGCDFCYAKSWAKRFGQPELWKGQRRRTSAANWKKPLAWNAQAKAEGRRYRVFCSSLADVFDNQVPDEWRAHLWLLISATPHLDWLLLTKRPQNIANMLPRMASIVGARWPWPNVWLGTTAENQDELNRRAPHLLNVEARVHFLSCEPLLGQLDLGNIIPASPILRPFDIFQGLNAKGSREVPHGIDWVIVGGESGPDARPMHPDWVRSLRDQCVERGVPFHFKQWGTWFPLIDRDVDDPDWRADYGRVERRPHDYRIVNLDGGTGFHGARVHQMERRSKERAGALIDGLEWREFPRMPGEGA